MKESKHVKKELHEMGAGHHEHLKALEGGLHHNGSIKMHHKSHI